MATPELIDIESLLQPIDDEQPAGIDIREDASPTSPYQTIKAERNQARAAERQNIHDGESQEAGVHWRAIIELAPAIMRDQAKDLEVASWYAEAMLRRHGFAGLKDAFSLIDGLIANFWDHLHPMPDEYGIETRVSCLSGLNGEGAEGVLIAPIRRVPITEGDNPGPYGYWQYRQALDTQKSPDEDVRRQKVANLGFGPEDIDKSVAQSSTEFFIDLRDDLSHCIALYRDIGGKLDELCGLEEAPPTRTICEVLEECLGAVNHLGKMKFPAEEAVVEEDAEAGDESSAPASRRTVAAGPIASREDAFRQLLEIADFFKQTEPHSPVSYVLQKAVKWGNMPLGELINELIPDHSSRERYSELTGVNTEEQN